MFRPGGELMAGEDQTAGLKRLLTEVWWCVHICMCVCVCVCVCVLDGEGSLVFVSTAVVVQLSGPASDCYND